MSHDLPQFISQGSDGTQEAENHRITAIADKLQRLCAIYEAQSGDSQSHVTLNRLHRTIH